MGQDRYIESDKNVFEEVGFLPSRIFLEDDEFQKAAGAFLYCCVDVAPWHYDLEKGIIMLDLARRNIDPARDEWWVFGGRRKIGESKKQAAIRHFHDDTGLQILHSRLIRLFHDDQIEYRWATGKEYANHVEAEVFALELMPAECTLASASLRESEYHSDLGIRSFDRCRLTEVNAHPAMIRIYDQICHIFGE